MASQALVTGAEVRKLLEREFSDGDDSENEIALFGDNSDDDPDYVEEGEDSISEESAEECEELEVGDTTEGIEETLEINNAGPSSTKRSRVNYTLKGKNGYIWCSECPARRGKSIKSNIVVNFPGVKGEARNIKTIPDAWKLLIDDFIIDKLVLHTNEEIIRKSSNYKVGSSTISETDKTEIYALIGLFYLAGALKNSKLNVDELWSDDFGNGIFRATMSKDRFVFLASCLRFDDKQTRQDRKQSDKFAAIREVWDNFILNCRKYYTSSTHCTIDEQLVSTRCRCPFRMYLPNKPGKYGIKIVMLNDSKTFYMCNALPYVGAVKCGPNQSVPQYYVETLVEDIKGTNRNVTTDNWFTSVPLVDNMLKTYQLTMLGTIRKNKREIPPSFLLPKRGNSSLFAFSGAKTLVSYAPRKNKNVILLSSMHHDDSVDTTTGKPNIILDYNNTKGGTDTFDQLCQQYTTARKSNRWPLRIWFAMLDQSGVNAYILYNWTNPTWNDSKKINRRSFLKELGMSLVKGNMERRLAVTSIQINLKVLICSILRKDNLTDVEPSTSTAALPSKSKSKRCFFCSRNKDKKAYAVCHNCKKPICSQHIFKVCQDCAWKSALC